MVKQSCLTNISSSVQNHCKVDIFIQGKELEGNQGSEEQGILDEFQDNPLYE